MRPQRIPAKPLPRGTTAAAGPEPPPHSSPPRPRGRGSPGTRAPRREAPRARGPAVRGPFLPGPAPPEAERPRPTPAADAAPTPPAAPARCRAALPAPPSSPALTGGRGRLPGSHLETPRPGRASLTAQRLRAAPGPRGARGIFFRETSPRSVGLSRPGRKSAQRREAATIRELRGDVNPPPRLPVPPASCGPATCGRAARPPPALRPLLRAPRPPRLSPELCAPLRPRSPRGAWREWGARWLGLVGPCVRSLSSEGTRLWGPGRAAAEERELEGVYDRGPFPRDPASSLASSPPLGVRRKAFSHRPLLCSQKRGSSCETP